MHMTVIRMRVNIRPQTKSTTRVQHRNCESGLAKHAAHRLQHTLQGEYKSWTMDGSWTGPWTVSMLHYSEDSTTHACLTTCLSA